MQRRDLRELPGGGAPVPPALRRPAGRIEIVPPAVEHAFFAPGDRRGARKAVGLPVDRPVVLFVGRIQPLKAPDVAIRALAALRRDDAMLVIVGGASGADGDDEVAAARARSSTSSGSRDRVRFVAPQPHHILSSYYRAADVVARAEPQRELRARRAGGRGVRRPGRGQRGRRAAQHRPRRRHRACSSTAATRPRYARAITAAARRSGRRGGDGRRGRGAGPALHVELHRGPAAPPLRRPRRPAGAASSSPARERAHA